MSMMSLIPWEMASITAPQKEISKGERATQKWKFCKVTQGAMFPAHIISFLGKDRGKCRG